MLLHGALSHVHAPGYAAILFRRTYPELAQDDGLIARSHAWLADTPASWNGTEHRWRFPSGATVAFGHLQHEHSKHIYQGGAWQYVAFDELTHFTESQYVYMHSRCRKPVDLDVPLRIRSASNPGGPGHDWVKRRFVDPGDPARPFVASLLSDNPHLDQASYLEGLRQLDATTRAQLEHGEWIRESGGLIYPYGPGNLVPLLPSLDGMLYGLGVDLGSSEQKPTTAFVVVAWHPKLQGLWVVQSEARAGMIPATIAGRIRELSEQFGGFVVTVLDEGALGKGYGNEFRVRYGIGCQPAEKQNKLGFRKLLRGELEQAQIQIVEPANIALLEEIGSLAWDKAGLDAEPGLADHCSDALLYAWRAARSYAHEPPEDRLSPSDPEYVEKLTQGWLERDREAQERRIRERDEWAE